MKTSIVVAIAALSMTAFAQTNATTTQVKPAAKKAVAAKKAKKPAQQAPATNLAPSEAPNTTTNVAPAVETQGATSSTPAAAPTVGTSTTTVTAAPEGKKWSASLVAQAELSNEAMMNPSKNSFSTINYVGAGYKVTPDTKVGFRQYFGYEVNPNETTKLTTEPTALTVGTKFKGIAGSDDIAPLFWYYVPTDALTKNLKANTDIQHNGIFRMDAEIAWTLNPKVTLSYYLNPRQSFVPKQAFINDKGEQKFTESDSRLIHQGYAYYNFTDASQVYATGGFDHRARTITATSHSDDAILAIGGYFVMGKFSFNPEIGNTVSLKKNGEYVSAPRWLQSEDMTYTLTAALNL